MSITQEGCREDNEQEQTDGISMCSGLSPVAVVYFMEDFKDKALNGVTCKSLCRFHMPTTHS
jgi:hypothetical protein